MNLGPHASFIVSAYMITSAIVAMLIAWVVLDHRAQARSLTALETRGMTRRSSPSAKVESGLASGNATMPPQ